jgi:hypothetical protein
MVVVWEEAAIRKHHFVNTRYPGANRRFFPHPQKTTAIPNEPVGSLVQREKVK